MNFVLEDSSEFKLDLKTENIIVFYKIWKWEWTIARLIWIVISYAGIVIVMRGFGKAARKFPLSGEDRPDNPPKIIFTRNSTKNGSIKTIKILKYSSQ